MGQRLRDERSEVVTNCHRLKLPAKEGGEVAGNARKDAEKRIGKPIISSENYIAEQEKKKRKKLEDKSNG